MAGAGIGSETLVIDLAVGGMHCASCVALIEEALSDDPGVGRAAVDLETGRASVVFRPDAVSVDDLSAVVADAGYGVEAAGLPRPAP